MYSTVPRISTPIPQCSWELMRKRPWLEGVAPCSGLDLECPPRAHLLEAGSLEW